MNLMNPQTRTYPLPAQFNPMAMSVVEIEEVVAMALDEDFELSWEEEDIERSVEGITIHAFDTGGYGRVTIHLRA